MIIDSTFLNDLVRGEAAATAKLETLVDDATPVAISPLTVYEVGIGLRGEATRHRPTYDAVLGEIDTAPFTRATAQQAVGIQQELLDRGERIGAVDVLIAATALAGDDGRVLTRNVDEFERVPGLSVERY